MCDEKFTSHTIKGHPKNTYAGRGTAEGVMTKAYRCVQGEGGVNLVSTYAFRLYIFRF